jgi:hypothetical protein
LVGRVGELLFFRAAGSGPGVALSVAPAAEFRYEFLPGDAVRWKQQSDLDRRVWSVVSEGPTGVVVRDDRGAEYTVKGSVLVLIGDELRRHLENENSRISGENIESSGSRISGESAQVAEEWVPADRVPYAPQAGTFETAAEKSPAAGRADVGNLSALSVTDLCQRMRGAVVQGTLVPAEVDAAERRVEAYEAEIMRRVRGAAVYPKWLTKVVREVERNGFPQVIVQVGVEEEGYFRSILGGRDFCNSFGLGSAVEAPPTKGEVP